MNTVTNDQGNHVYAADIARYKASGAKVPGNRAFKFVWRDFPLQQSSRLDKRLHQESRAGIHGGEYASGYEVWKIAPLGCLYRLTILLDHLQGFAS